MKHFAKLFTLVDGSQVLLVRSWNDEEQGYEVEITTEVDSVRASVKLGFGSEVDCDKCFDNFGLTDAEIRINETQKMLRD